MSRHSGALFRSSLAGHQLPRWINALLLAGINAIVISRSTSSTGRAATNSLSVPAGLHQRAAVLRTGTFVVGGRTTYCAKTRRLYLPTTGGYPTVFTAVTAPSNRDVWALGELDYALGDQLIAAHWDGRQWRVSHLLSKKQAPHIESMSAVSSTDIWAVGVYNNPERQALIEHWDGSRWRVSAGPRIAASELSGVEALASDDAWAVGVGSIRTAGSEPLIEHWDGKRWRTVPLGGAIAYGSINAITATSVRDVWAAGENLDTYGTALVAHFDGRHWTALPGLSDARIQTKLTSVAAAAPRDIWAVGTVGDAQTPAHKIVEHWDGLQWRLVSDVPGVTDTLIGVVAASAHDVWAVGGPLVEHWDGRRWHRQSAVPGDSFGAAAITGLGDAWAVGSSQRYAHGQAQAQPLAEHFTLVPCATP